MILEAANLKTLSLQWQAQGFLLLDDRLDLTGLDLSQLQPARLQEKTRGGSRDLLAHPLCQLVLQRLRDLPQLQQLLPLNYAAIHCTYFEKSAERNWLVAWHQDLSLAMPAPNQHSDWTGWSCKEGRWFAQPPAEFLAQCIALRVHLDPCGLDDGALRVLPGTHTSGRLSVQKIAQLQQEISAEYCYAEIGEILMLRPALLHASSKSKGESRRRVLHYVFAPVPNHWQVVW